WPARLARRRQPDAGRGQRDGALSGRSAFHRDAAQRQTPGRLGHCRDAVRIAGPAQRYRCTGGVRLPEDTACKAARAALTAAPAQNRGGPRPRVAPTLGWREPGAALPTPYAPEGESHADSAGKSKQVSRAAPAATSIH